MDPQPITPVPSQTPAPSVGTLVVHFSDPSAWRLGTQPQTRWKLSGEGEVTFEKDRIVLRGRRRRPLWFAAGHEVPIPFTDIANVIREGDLVQCQVSTEGGTKELKLWATTEAAAEQMELALPRTRTAEFEQQVAELKTFNAALAALGTRPVATWALVALNCAVFVATVFAGAGLFQPDSQLLIHWGTNYGPRTLDGESWRLATSMFLHFGVLHLLFNMWALWDVGRLTEKLYGSAYFLALYVFAGLSGSLASLFWHPDLNSAGASGAIFGVLGGLLAFIVNPKTRIPASVAAAHKKSAVVFICYNLFNGFAHAGIDNAAHIGGLVGGFAMGWLLARPVDKEARENPAPRLALGTLLGAILLITLSWPLFHPNATVAADRNFRKQFQLFAQDEEKVVAATHELEQLESTHKISPEEWAQRLSKEIIPKWRAAEDHISSAKLPEDSRLAPLRAAMIDYLDEKRLTLDFLSDGVRYNDAEKLERGTQLAKKNEAKMEEVRALIRQVY